MRKHGKNNFKIKLISEELINSNHFVNNINLPNIIEDYNNCFRFTVGNKIFDFELDTGYYTFDCLVETINDHLFDYEDKIIIRKENNKCIISVAPNCTVDFTIDNCLNSYLGFDDVVLTEGIHTGKRDLVI